jgi:hypothetical protein
MAQQYEQRWQDWVNLILGAWLFLSPWFGLASTSTSAWNAWVFGAVIAAFSVWALALPQRWEEWINLIVGVWVLIAPFVLAFTDQTGATWNHIIVGIIVGIDAIWAMAQTPVQRAA